MTVAEFKQELETFLGELNVHRLLWEQSLDKFFPSSLPRRNAAQLRLQSDLLSRRLGRIRPYIERYVQNWMMHVQVTGTRWNALDAAVSANVIPQIKGSSIRQVTEQLHQLLGRLDGEDAGKELGPSLAPAAPAPIRTTFAPMASPSVTPPPKPASPPPTPSNAPPEPVTLEKVAIHDLVSALGRLSLGAVLTILGLLVGLVGMAATVTRAIDQRAINALRDSVRAQQQVVNAERLRSDSLAARLRRPTRNTP